MAAIQSEAELVAAAKAGDRSARDELVLAIDPVIRQFAERAARRFDCVEADDVAQELRILAMRWPATFDPAHGHSWKKYACNRLRGAVIDVLRKNDPLGVGVPQKSREAYPTWVDVDGCELAARDDHASARDEIDGSRDVSSEVEIDGKQEAWKLWQRLSPQDKKLLVGWIELWSGKPVRTKIVRRGPITQAAALGTVLNAKRKLPALRAIVGSLSDDDRQKAVKLIWSDSQPGGELRPKLKSCRRVRFAEGQQTLFEV